MNDEKIIKWLLEDDVSVQYQVHRDLLGSEQNLIQQRIAKEGWGAGFLSRKKGEWTLGA